MNLLGKLTSKDGPARLKNDQAKSEKSVQRIQGHIRDCSRARHDLVDLQKKMALVCNHMSDDFQHDLHEAFSGCLRRKNSFCEREMPRTPECFEKCDGL